jgi:hypothetical protein
MTMQRAWRGVTYDGANIQAVQLRGESQWLRANAYVEVSGEWCRVHMDYPTVNEYPASQGEWREYCASVAAVFTPESVTA